MTKYLDFQDILLTPQYSQITSRKQCNPRFNFLGSNQTPIIAANMDTVGTFQVAKVLAQYHSDTAVHKYHELRDLIYHFSDPQILLHAWYTMGIKAEDVEKLRDLLRVLTPRKVCIDVANGHTENFVDVCETVRKLVPNAILMAGNIGNPDMVPRLEAAGVNVIKAGIGSGSLCLTRRVTGIGVPQVTLIRQCADKAKTAAICSDGGITCPGDVVKALAVGATFVMIGGEFAGHDENTPDDSHEAVIYGMSSVKANEKYCDGLGNYKTSEGREVQISHRGSIRGTIEHYLGGLRSGMAYCGVTNPLELKNSTTVIEVNRQLNNVYEVK